MNLLIDTCDFLWLISGGAKLTRRRREALLDQENSVFLSAISSAEIAVKCSIGKLSLPDSPDRYIPEARDKHQIHPLPVIEEAIVHIADLPLHHRDPFDRMLISQANLPRHDSRFR